MEITKKRLPKEFVQAKAPFTHCYEKQIQENLILGVNVADKLFYICPYGNETADTQHLWMEGTEEKLSELHYLFTNEVLIYNEIKDDAISQLEITNAEITKQNNEIIEKFHKERDSWVEKEDGLLLEIDTLKAELDKIKEAHKVFLAAIEPERSAVIKVGDKVQFNGNFTQGATEGMTGIVEEIKEGDYFVRMTYSQEVIQVYSSHTKYVDKL